MPRDLEESKGSVWKGIAQLEESPSETTFSYEDADMTESPPSKSPNAGALIKSDNSNTIKPYVQALTWLDLDSCVKLEEVTFPPRERCSREKFEYRFAKCGELSLGLFTSADTSSTATDSASQSGPAHAATAATSPPVYSGTPARKCVLLAQIIATKTTNETVRDEDMALPPDWRSEHAKSMSSPSVVSPPSTPQLGSAAQNKPKPGHKEEGRTLCIHSLGVLPGFQRRGLAKLLLRSFIQRMEGSGVADRIAIIVHDELIGFYEGMGFESKGKSKVQFGEGGWTDMVLDLRAGD